MTLRLAAIVAFAAACALPSGASAQSGYFVRLVGTLGAPTCAVDGATGPANVTQVWNLPDAPDNAMGIYVVNGGAPVVQLETLPPISIPSPLTSWGVGLPTPTPLPWTLVLTFSPAQGGVAVGNGARLFVSCPESGLGTVSFVNLGESATPVPALPVEGLAALSALLALAAAWRVRQRRA